MKDDNFLISMIKIKGGKNIKRKTIAIIASVLLVSLLLTVVAQAVTCTLKSTDINANTVNGITYSHVTRLNSTSYDSVRVDNEIYVDGTYFTRWSTSNASTTLCDESVQWPEDPEYYGCTFDASTLRYELFFGSRTSTFLGGTYDSDIM